MILIIDKDMSILIRICAKKPENEQCQGEMVEISKQTKMNNIGWWLLIRKDANEAEQCQMTINWAWANEDEC